MPDDPAPTTPPADAPPDNVHERVQSLEQALHEAQQTIAHLERRQHIDALLAEADAIDLDAARLLTERTVEQMDEPDVAMAVDELRRRKPYLFRQRDRDPGLMPPREGEAPTPLDDAAQRAVATGDRRDLLTYLRLRRRA